MFSKKVCWSQWVLAICVGVFGLGVLAAERPGTQSLPCPAVQAGAPDQAVLPINAPPAHRVVDEAAFWQIGGISQWVTIRGDDCANPIILFLHGGPGNPLSPFADQLYGEWTHRFTLVQWDQRGAGMTFGANPDSDQIPLSIELMTNDGIALAEALTKRLGQRKLILMGSSWGSALGIHMAKRRPDLFHAYVGTAQMVSDQANSMASYTQTLALATIAHDDNTIAALQAIGPPPRKNPHAFGVLRRAIRAYEAKVTVPAPAAWWQATGRYATSKALADTEQGEDFSFIQFVGMQGDGMLSKVDLPALGYRFDLPVFIVQGQEDLLTPINITQNYVDQIAAPSKAMVIVPKAGHDPNPPLRDAQWQLLIERVLPLLKPAR